MAREGAFDGVDAALMVHPAGDDLDPHEGDRRPGAHRHLHGAGRPRGRLPAPRAATPSTPPCSATSTSPPCGSTSCPTSASTACSSRRGRSRTSSPPAPSPSGWCAPRASPPSSRSRRGWPRASRPGATAAGCEVDIAWKAVVYADMLDNEAMVGALRRQRRRPRPPGRGAARRGGRGRQHRHGQRQLPRAVDPPDDRGRPVGPAHPHARVRRATPGPESGDRAVVDGAVALAWTVADLWLGDGALEAVRAEFAATIERVGRRGPAVRDRGGGRRVTYGSRRPPGPADDRLHRRGVHARRGGHPPALLHEPRRSRVRARQPPGGREGGALRPLLPQLEEPAAPLPRRVRRRPRHQRRRHHRRHRRASGGPRSSTTGCSSSTATTRSPSSAACTWPASRRRTCSPRCSSGAA